MHQTPILCNDTKLRVSRQKEALALPLQIFAPSQNVILIKVPQNATESK